MNEKYLLVYNLNGYCELIDLINCNKLLTCPNGKIKAIELLLSIRRIESKDIKIVLEEDILPKIDLPEKYNYLSRYKKKNCCPWEFEYSWEVV